MDTTIVVAATGIIGAIVGIVGSYFVQNAILERQRKRALEDEGRRIKRELLSKRLDIIEESAKIMRNEVEVTVAIQFGIPVYNDKEELKAQGKRLQSISGEAWAALASSDSKELTENWNAIAKAYRENEETGQVNPDVWEEAHGAYIEIIKLTDAMRSQV